MSYSFGFKRSTIFLFLTTLGIALLVLGAGVSRANAGSADNNVEWASVLHDSFDANYRSPGGPVTSTTTVKLRLRVGQSDITSARVRVWNDRTNSETYYPMAWDGGFDTDP